MAMNLPRLLLIYWLGFQENIFDIIFIPPLSLVYSCAVSFVFYPLVKLISRICPPQAAVEY